MEVMPWFVFPKLGASAVDLADVKERRIVRVDEDCLRPIFCLSDLTMGVLNQSISGCCEIRLADVRLCMLRNLTKAFMD